MGRFFFTQKIGAAEEQENRRNILLKSNILADVRTALTIIALKQLGVNCPCSFRPKDYSNGSKKGCCILNEMN